MERKRIELDRAARRLETSRLFWWCLGLAALTAAVAYLQVTRLAPLGGDDQYGNLTAYYELTQQGVWGTWQEELQGIWHALALGDARFFPFSSVPAPIRYWAKGDIDRYRLFIIGHTLVDAGLLGLLVGKATGNRRLGAAFFALLPLMVCLWSDYTTNGMYSYEALPQASLLPALLAGLCMVALHKSWHIRWALLGGVMTFWACGIYEIGYTYIFMLGLLALLLEPRFWRAVRLGLPFLAGEIVALVFYVLSARLNASGGGYDGVQASWDLQAALRTWAQQMSAGFPLNTILFSDTHVNAYTAGDVLWPLLLAAVCVACLCLGKWTLRARHAVCLFFIGLSLLALPALLVGISGKYQNDWISWQKGYIPAVVESFGVALMLLTLLAALFQAARKGSRWLSVVLAVAVLAGLTACGACQRAAARERYDNGARDTYEFLCDSVAAGLADEVPEDSPLVCEFNVWGGSKAAQEAFFLRYGGIQRNAYNVDSWEKDPQPNGEDIYFLCYVCSEEGYDVAWVAHVTDVMTRFADSVKVYIQGERVPADAVLGYITQTADGAEQQHQVPIADLPRTQPEENGDYFVMLEGENIVSRRISLWP